MCLVSFTVLDPAGNPYAGGLIEAIFTNNTGSNTLPLASGSVFQTFVVGELDSFGSGALTITGNDLITPAGTQWTFNVVDATRKIGFSALITITGTTQNISAALQAAAAPLNPAVAFGNITVTGLTDSGSALFNGNVTATAGQNTLVAYKFNRVLYVDGVKYPQTDAGVKAALADAVTQGGGRVVIPDSVNITKSSQWTLGTNLNKQPVELEIGTGASITETTTGGVDGFLLSDGCGIVGHGGIGEANGGGPNNNSRINLASTCNLNALIAPTDRTGAQEGLYLANFVINGNASATIASAIFDIQGIFINTYMSNIYTQTIPCKCLRVRAGTSVKICSDLYFSNCNFDCTNAAGGIPVSIEGAAASEITNITFIGGGIQHAGNNQPLISINGAGVANGAHHVAFIRIHLETQGTPGTSSVTFADTNHILFLNCRVSGPVATNIFTLSETVGGLTHDIQIQQLQTTSTPTNLVNNLINSTTVPTSIWQLDLLSYQWKGSMFSDTIIMPVQTKNYVAAGDTTAGGLHLTPISANNNQMTAITSAASTGAGVYGNGSPSSAEAGIYFEGAAGFGTRMHFGTTNSFATGSIVGMTLDEFGNLQLQRSGSKISQYNAINTAGGGVAVVYGATSQRSESAADANVLTFTPPATVGSYRLRFTMAVSAQNTATLGWTATWKDANAAAQAPTNLALFTTGTAAPALTVTAATNGNYHGQADIDTDASATAIVIKLTFAGTSFTAKVSASVERII